MGALSAQFLNQHVDPLHAVPICLPGGILIAAGVKIWANAVVCKNAAGYAVPLTADPTLIVLGRLHGPTADNTTGAAGAFRIDVDQGCFDYDIASGVNAVTLADVGNVVFGQDDHTFSKTDQGGTLPRAGVLSSVYTPANSSTARAVVQLGASLSGLLPVTGKAGNAPFTARAVITSIAAYVVASGVLTAAANGAIGAQDGVTLEAGDIVVLPAVEAGAATEAAEDVGPYVVDTVGTASTKYVLKRPSWWQHGAGIPCGRSIEVGGEGTVWGGSEWKALCAKNLVVGTGSPLLYPRVQKGTGAVGTQVTGLFATTNAVPSAMDTTAAHFVLPALVAGYGVGTLDFTGTGADAIKYAVFNY